MISQRSTNFWSRPPYEWPVGWQYVLALGLVAVALLTRWLLGAELGGRASFLLLFCALLPLPLLVRPVPFIVAAVCGFLTAWFVFLPPAMSFFITGVTEAPLIGIFGIVLGTTVLTGWLSHWASNQRLRDQRAMLETARKLQLVTDSTPALIAYVDADMRYRLANKVYETWFGGKGASLEGVHMRELLGEDAFGRIRPHAEAALSGKRAEFETEIPRTEGGARFVHGHYVPDVQADGTIAGFYAMVSDISQRKRIEDELRLRSEQFRTLLSSAPLGVYLVDADFRMRQVNPVAEQVFSQIPGGVIDRRLDEVLHLMWGRDRAEELLRIFHDTLESGSSFHFPEFAELRVDRGVPEYYDWRVERIVLPDGRYGVVCYFRDVSEQVISRKAIAESEARYRTLFESIEQGFCIMQMVFDDQDRPVDYRYLEINPAFETQTGMKNAIGKTVRELVPDIEPFWFDLYGRVALTGEPARIVDHAKSMGRWFEVEAFRIGDPDQRRVAVLFADITKRKTSEEALLESEERFRSMADSAPVLIWLSDTSRDCTYFNLQWLTFTGRSPEDELGNGWTEGIHPDDRAQCVAIYSEAFAARRKFRREYRLRRHDGEYRWMADQGVPRHLSNGEFAGYIGSCIDITGRKESEEALRQIDRRKDDFLATLAHELRNPLAAISTATNVMDHVRDDSARAGQMRAIIKRQSEQLVRLIDDLLDVSRIARNKVKLEREHVDFASIVRNVVDDCLVGCEEKGLTFVRRVTEGPVMAYADPVRLSQVVTNLLENACKFTPRGGKIDVSLEQECGEAILRVADTGIGITREHLARIFDMFTQAAEPPSQRTGGLGIGLSLTKSIIEMHGGTIEARSDGPGTGSEFVVRLRLAQSAPAEKRAEPCVLDVQPTDRTTGARIVAADDNTDALDSLALMLRMNGHQVETAIDGAEALQKIKEYRPDVALLDIGMPHIDGYEVARRLGLEPWRKAITLVAMTGWGQKRDKEQALEAGFDLHLTKPVDPTVLEQVLATRREVSDLMDDL